MFKFSTGFANGVAVYDSSLSDVTPLTRQTQDSAGLMFAHRIRRWVNIIQLFNLNSHPLEVVSR